MFALGGRIARRAIVRRRGTTTTVGRILLVLTAVQWLRRRAGGSRTLVLDPSESYEIIVEPGGRRRAGRVR